MSKPEVIAVAEFEGGPWITWSNWQKRPVAFREGKLIHAVKFADRSVWNAFNGWRSEHKIDAEGWAEAAFDKPLMYIPPRVASGDYLDDVHRLDNWPWR